MLYLDDGIVAANGFEAATQASHKMNWERSGLVAHVEKLICTPVQSLSWLYLNQGVASVPMP